MDKWLKYFDKYNSNENVIKILIGNKMDLIVEREVSIDEAQKYANINKLDYYEISAQYDINVNECFLDITKSIINEHDLIKEPKS